MQGPSIKKKISGFQVDTEKVEKICKCLTINMDSVGLVAFRNKAAFTRSNAC